MVKGGISPPIMAIFVLVVAHAETAASEATSMFSIDMWFETLRNTLGIPAEIKVVIASMFLLKLSVVRTRDVQRSPGFVWNRVNLPGHGRAHNVGHDVILLDFLDRALMSI